ncbi:MAG TPA: YtxH domain-containing protein, partial [Actinomycetes bacterium]|nr:YtxH domain-containing protein [Actinomycetes bacterium]
MKGKLGIAVGLAAGYVLGTRAGRERYQQLTASAKR